jgi:hypothetical protein
MKKKKITQTEILDQCLTLIQLGKASIPDCLQTYPEYAGFIEPLLLIALQVQSTLAPDDPNDAFVAATKMRIVNQLRASRKAPQTVRVKPHRRRLFIPRPAMAAITLVCAFIMLISGFGVTSVSAKALPGDSLYPVKRSMEELRLLLTTSPTEDAKLLTEYMGRRLQEMEELSKLDSSQDLELSIQEYEGMLSRLLEIAQDEEVLEDTETLEVIDSGFSKQEEVLQRVLDAAPPSAQTGLENAIEHSDHGKEVIQTIKEGGNPSDLAPGQQKRETEDQTQPEDEDHGSKSKDKSKGPKPKDETPEP